MARFFISYRRGDSAGHTGRLNDTLAQRFGHDAVFRDIEDLAPGMNFADELDRALAECSGMLVVIGRTWATVSDDQGRRLFQESDFVRREVAAALAREDVLAIPVLVDGATLPSADELPEDLQSLRGHQSIEISDERWDYDVQRLGDALVTRLGLSEIEATPAAKKSWVPLGILGTAAIAVAATVIVVLLQTGSDGSSDDAPATDTQVTTTGTAVTTTGIAVTTTVPFSGTTEPSGIDVPTFVVGDLTWTTDTEATGAVDWVEASAFCGQIGGSGVSFRLPTIAELETIADPTDPSAFDHKILRIFHDGLGSNWIWSSDKDGVAAAFAYDFIELSEISLALNDKLADPLCVSD